MAPSTNTATDNELVNHFEGAAAVSGSFLFLQDVYRIKGCVMKRAMATLIGGLCFGGGMGGHLGAAIGLLVAIATVERHRKKTNESQTSNRDENRPQHA